MHRGEEIHKRINHSLCERTCVKMECLEDASPPPLVVKMPWGTPWPFTCMMDVRDQKT